MKLIANMIVRNEEDRFLTEVFTHLRGIADVILVTDDCSDDGTFDIAMDWADGVQRLPEPTFAVHEGKLRQASWNFVKEHADPGDWILAIDADEKLFDTQNQLEALLDQSQWDVLGVTFYHMWNSTHWRTDKAWKPNVSSRLFRYYEGGEFLNRKLACGSEPTYVQQLIRSGRALWHTGLAMQHLGYVRDEDKKMKYKRYMELDGGDFHARAHIESILDPNPALMEWLYA